ncbi:aminoglycoside phosphotransferase family protein [Streptomyces sp. A7024]|uniref:Aminoglycoside phosphotransferase family protein n=1 Tax=Streptomyces coryli TaxID=1128680 RepID=A0A6G4TW28_9ACTN|nr:aminoglycoside phosphotransferase family protein [Streptomyces coryli]
MNKRHPGRRLLAGYHNRNYVAPLGKGLAAIAGCAPGTYAKFRIPLRTLEVVPRCWEDEQDVLDAVQGHVRHVPTPLARVGKKQALHTYVEGLPLGYRYARGDRIDQRVLVRIVEVMKQIADVPSAAVPPRPQGWPKSGDSPEFLRQLVRFAEQRVRQRYRSDFGGLFDSVGIPHDVVTRFDKPAAGLARRDFCLLHTDLHRGNLVLLPGGDELLVIDWEIALYGDPLHELATHLVRMGYRDEEWETVVELWKQRFGRGHEIDYDLAVYVAFERAQSVLTDTMRAAQSLKSHPSPWALAGAAENISRALAVAEIQPPKQREISQALRAWLRHRSAPAPSRT